MRWWLPIVALALLPTVLAVCGDGTLDGGEVCEQGDVVSCLYGRGYRECMPDCSGYGGCQLMQSCGDGLCEGVENCDICPGDCCDSAVCGDGTVQGGEVCDGDTRACTVDGYAGEESCAGDCAGYDACVASEFCGDGSVNGDEECDGPNLDGQSCASLGYSGGSLTCSACTFDTSGCTGATCGNGVVEGTEVCDGNAESCSVDGYAGSRTCNTACDGFNACVATESCGDGVINGNEACDGSDLGGASCASLGFGGGTLSCAACVLDTSACEPLASCGNGLVDPGEECDGGTRACTEFGYDMGTATCSDCVWNLAECQMATLCGNGIVDDGEECDGGNQSCTINGYDGAQQCRADCAGYDTCATTQSCGDGVKNGDEVCDGEDLDGMTCELFGFIGGELACDACVWDMTDCEIDVLCGNGLLDEGEECDGTTGVPDGYRCTAACRLEAIATCGNGVVDPGEECDDGNTNDVDACSNACTTNPCADESCDPGDSCPLLDHTCPTETCYMPMCEGGCTMIPLPAGASDEECRDGRICDGAGTCVESAGTRLTVIPEYTMTEPGQAIRVDIRIAGVEHLQSYQFDLQHGLTYLETKMGEFLSGNQPSDEECDGVPDAPTCIIRGVDEGPVLSGVAEMRLLSDGVSGSGRLVKIRLIADEEGVLPLTLKNTLLLDANGDPMEHDTSAGSLIVRDLTERLETYARSGIIFANYYYEETGAAIQEANCTLNITGEQMEYDTALLYATAHSFPPGTHTWQVTCDGTSTEGSVTIAQPSDSGGGSSGGGSGGGSGGASGGRSGGWIPLDEESCSEAWVCTKWTCSEGVEVRTCNDLNACGTALTRPIEQGGSCNACSNGNKDPGEVGVDCGGPCAACPPRLSVRSAPIFASLLEEQDIPLTITNDGNPIDLEVVIPELKLRERVRVEAEHAFTVRIDPLHLMNTKVMSEDLKELQLLLVTDEEVLYESTLPLEITLPDEYDITVRERDGQHLLALVINNLAGEPKRGIEVEYTILRDGKRVRTDIGEPLSAEKDLITLAGIPLQLYGMGAGDYSVEATIYERGAEVTTLTRDFTLQEPAPFFPVGGIILIIIIAAGVLLSAVLARIYIER